eukprot:6185754-Pleurochrysis_carterae.AAC.2
MERRRWRGLERLGCEERMAKHEEPSQQIGIIVHRHMHIYTDRTEARDRIEGAAVEMKASRQSGARRGG